MLNHIAKWNGTNWLPLGSGMNSNVYALALDNSNNLYAGGQFTIAGGSNASCVAKWNGTNWTQQQGGAQPSERYAPGEAALGNKVVLFGGVGPVMGLAEPALNDTEAVGVI